MSSPLLLQQCPACLNRLILIVFLMGGWCPYSCCFVGCCFQDLFNTARGVLVQLPSSFLSILLVSVHVVHPYSDIDTMITWKKKLLFILSDSSDIQLTDSLSNVLHAFASYVLISFSIDETLLSRKVNLSTSFRDPLFSEEMSPLWLKHLNSVLSALT